MNKGTEIRIVPSYNGVRDFSVFIEKIQENKFFRAKPLEFVEVSLYETDIYSNSLSLSKATTQQLMDDLWTCGIRPSEGQGSAGQLAAVQGHLTDMRAIVSKKLGVELK